MVYDVIDSDQGGSSPQLKEAWRVKAGQNFDSPQAHLHHDDDSKIIGDKDGKRDVVEKTPASVSCKDTGTDYHYGDAFYMAEINPSGNVFAVEERPGKSTLARLYSHGGELLHTSELHAPITAAVDTKDAEKSAKTGDGDKRPGVQTLLISTYKAGCYALVVQGGYVLLVDAEKLTIANSFKVVSRPKSGRPYKKQRDHGNI